ncbi:Hypothetical protein NTJ_05186 [Nesidiocoris tenuis]|uniref:Uncharacterized protein n=1 Tax=Nesidiocoris tenuis TaxID=355587 RepID=A0ABN7APP8_9HEMI|nr:Hypothetical protein NTJ_05186 [Nesidiocoris tenuis]
MRSAPSRLFRWNKKILRLRIGGVSRPTWGPEICVGAFSLFGAIHLVQIRPSVRPLSLRFAYKSEPILSVLVCQVCHS